MFQNVKAQRAMMEMRGFSLKGSRLQTDYASHECRARFFELCKKYGIDIKERSRPWEEDNSQDSSYRYVNPPQHTRVLPVNLTLEIFDDFRVRV